MATIKQPLTRSEFRAELEHYATKADLAALETRIIRVMANQLGITCHELVYRHT